MPKPSTIASALPSPPAPSARMPASLRRPMYKSLGHFRSATRPVPAATASAGVALAEAVAAGTGLVADLKWPNDLYIGRRKLAGILAEGAGGEGNAEAIVLGFGINVSAAAYPPAL